MTPGTAALSDTFMYVDRFPEGAHLTTVYRKIGDLALDPRWTPCWRLRTLHVKGNGVVDFDYQHEEGDRVSFVDAAQPMTPCPSYRAIRSVCSTEEPKL